jgi:hypothetical protein
MYVIVVSPPLVDPRTPAGALKNATTDARRRKDFVGKKLVGETGEYAGHAVTTSQKFTFGVTAPPL